MRKMMMTLMVALMAIFSCQSCISLDTNPVSKAIKSSESTVMVMHPIRGGGSGVYIGNDKFLTCAHVVRNTDTVIIRVNGKSYAGKVIKIDLNNDLALIICKNTGLVPAVVAKEKPSVGDEVMSSGHPYLQPKLLSFGRVGALQKGIIIHDSAVNPGNSGGPLFNYKGEIVGINRAIVTRFGEFAGISIATDTDAINKFLK